MSSNGGNRKSMDDVLSSIRRIIGNDPKEQDDDAGPADASAEPLRLGEPVAPGRRSSSGSDDKLSLTPNMRTDRLTGEPAAPAEQAEEAPLSLGGMEAEPSRPAAAPEPPQPTQAPATTVSEDEESIEIDEAALEDMIRRIVREELATALAEDEEIETRMRAVVQDDLMGETGQNISRNVQAMVRAEVERMFRDRGL